jgi:hypothetical protein
MAKSSTSFKTRRVEARFHFAANIASQTSMRRRLASVVILSVSKAWGIERSSVALAQHRYDIWAPGQVAERNRVVFGAETRL